MLFIRLPAPTNVPVIAKLIFDWKEPAKPIELSKLKARIRRTSNEPVKVLIAPVKALRVSLFSRLPVLAIVPVIAKLIFD